MKEKRKTKFQREREERDRRIRATYESLAPGTWKLRELAKMFGCSISTVHYAIHGRDGKAGKVKGGVN